MKGRAKGWLFWPGYEETEFHLLLDGCADEGGIKANDHTVFLLEPSK